MNPTQTLNIQQGNLQMLLGLGVAVLLAKALTQTTTESLPSRISPNENSSSSSQPLRSNSSVQDSSSLPLAGSAHNSIYTSTAKDRNLTYQVSVQGSVTFKACDIFREDATSLLIEEYPAWVKCGFWKSTLCLPQKEDSHIQRVVKVIKCISALSETEQVGSIHLSVAYLLLYICYKALQGSFECRASFERVDRRDSILRQLYAEDWNTVDDKTRKRRLQGLKRQISVGKRWFVAVNKLSFGAIILCGRRLCSIVHNQRLSARKLMDLFSHILENFPGAVRIFQSLDSLVRTILAGEECLPELGFYQIATEIESYSEALHL